MAASTFLPTITVEIAFNAGYTTPAASRTWTDVSDYVEAQSLINISRGRQDELSDVSPSTLQVTFDNKDGRFTPGYTSGAYYPNVKKGRPIRVSAVWPVAGGVTYRRFTGYVDEWPVQWPDPGAAMSTVTVTANSRMARLGRTAAMRSLVETEYLQDAPDAYYIMGDPEGSLVAQGSAGSEPSMQIAGTGSAVVFGNATGPGTDGFTAAQFTGGKYLMATLESPLALSTTILLEAFVSTSTSGAQVVAETTTPVAGWLSLGLNASGQAYAEDGGSSHVVVSSVNGSVSIADGNTHHLAVRKTRAFLINTMTLFVDGVPVDSDALAAASYPSKVLTVARSGTESPVDLGFTGTIAHVALTYGTGAEVSDARIADHAAAGLTGFAGESSDEWVERIGGYAGVPLAEISTDTGNSTSVAFIDTTDKAPVEVMQAVTKSENGLLFDAADGTLTFQSRGHRYGATSVLSLSAATQQIQQGITPKLDDQGMLNDVTVSRVNGAAVRVVNQASVDDAGLYQQSVELLTTFDSEVTDYANFLVNTYGEPGVRVPDCSVQLVTQSSATVTALLALELGDLITLTGLPTQAPASSMTFFVEGIREDIGMTPSEHWMVSLNLSPGDIPGTVWTLGTSQLDTSTVLAY